MCLQDKPFENTVGKEEIARNEKFLFSHNVFYPFRELSAIFIKFKFVVCILFRFGKVKYFDSDVWERVKCEMPSRAKLMEIPVVTSSITYMNWFFRPESDKWIM